MKHLVDTLFSLLLFVSCHKDIEPTSKEQLKADIVAFTFDKGGSVVPNIPKTEIDSDDANKVAIFIKNTSGDFSNAYVYYINGDNEITVAEGFSAIVDSSDTVSYHVFTPFNPEFTTYYDYQDAVMSNIDFLSDVVLRNQDSPKGVTFNLSHNCATLHLEFEAPADDITVKVKANDLEYIIEPAISIDNRVARADVVVDPKDDLSDVYLIINSSKGESSYSLSNQTFTKWEAGQTYSYLNIKC
ncbi:MAG: hypothetical protein R3Y04_01910 [Rikenellaceae bacterium]